jgi:hypothetical protein
LGFAFGAPMQKNITAKIPSAAKSKTQAARNAAGVLAQMN